MSDFCKSSIRSINELALLNKLDERGGHVHLRELDHDERLALRRLERRGQLLRVKRGTYGEVRGLA